MGTFKDAVRANAADEASTATALRDKADMLDAVGDHKKASVYRNAAAKADNRASVWRDLLR